ncbi:Hypothetical predicted protein [Mytilus galloprovincialis]|uniref:Uncharacterized protein n=1 Tax=Mytilus galloprovincialis TaxID=29158 RepID=A0A8B6BWP9_MYTGA|nr:Hypothetical predicted protein [Mytilus galloprovincialis]
MASGVRDEDSLRLVHCLSTRNESIRKQGLNMISKLTDSWIEGYGSPVNTIYMSNGQKNGTSMSNGKKNGSHPLLKEHLPDFVRLAYECPFEDVREFFCELIADIQVTRLIKILIDNLSDTVLSALIYFSRRNPVSVRDEGDGKTGGTRAIENGFKIKGTTKSD